MKKCTRCGIEKSLDDFNFRGDFKHLKKSHCKKCDSEKTKLWCLKNPEKYKKAYEKTNANKDFVKEGRKRYEKDPDYYKKWYWSNQELRKKKLETRKLWLKKNPNKQAEYA